MQKYVINKDLGERHFLQPRLENHMLLLMSPARKWIRMHKRGSSGTLQMQMVWRFPRKHKDGRRTNFEKRLQP